MNQCSAAKSYNNTNVLNSTKTFSRSLVSATVLHSKAHLLTKLKDRQWIRAETQIINKNKTFYLMELWRPSDKSDFWSYRKMLKQIATCRQILNKPINGLLSCIEFGPIYRSYLENGRRVAHIRWIPVELFKIYFYFAAAGAVPCVSRKKPPRASSIVKINDKKI